jgi:hypothetical protein
VLKLPFWRSVRRLATLLGGYSAVAFKSHRGSAEDAKAGQAYVTCDGCVVYPVQYRTIGSLRSPSTHERSRAPAARAIVSRSPLESGALDKLSIKFLLKA